MRVIVAGLLVLLGYLPAFAQSGAPVTLAEFVADLDRIAAAVRNASPEEGALLASSVPLRWRVIVGAHRIEADGTWLIHALREGSNKQTSWTERRISIYNRLTATREHAADLLGAPSSADPSGRVRRAAGEILARPEYQQAAAEHWLEGIQRRIAEWLGPLFRAFGASRVGRRETAIVVAWIAAVAAFAVFGTWLARLLGRPAQAVTLGMTSPRTAQLSSREWARRAAAAARTGDYRESVHCAYNAAIRRVEEQGLCRFDPTRTPREYLRLLPPDDERRLPVRELTEQFERAWYGNRFPSDDDLRRVTVNLERLGCAYPADRAI